MSKVTQNYEQLAQAIGFHLDGNIMYGERGGYQLLIYAADSRYPYALTVSLSVKPQNGIFLSKEEKKQFVKEHAVVGMLKQEGNLITMALGGTSKQDRLRENLETEINNLVTFLHTRGYVACCQYCGQEVPTTGQVVVNSYMNLCEECVNKMRHDMTIAYQQKSQKKENLIGGMVGAFLGSIIGILCIIFFSQMGRVAVISGVVMAVCTLKGYEMLGSKLTKKGIAVCIIMMLAMTYVGDRMDWAIMIVRELESGWGTDLLTAYRFVPNLLAEGYIDSGSYWANLALLYAFTIGGAVPTVSNIVKQRNDENVIRQIGSNGSI